MSFQFHFHLAGFVICISIWFAFSFSFPFHFYCPVTPGDGPSDPRIAKISRLDTLKTRGDTPFVCIAVGPARPPGRVSDNYKLKKSPRSLKDRGKYYCPLAVSRSTIRGAPRIQ